MRLTYLSLAASMVLFHVGPLIAQGPQPWDRRFERCADWLAAGAKIPPGKTTVDVRGIKNVKLSADPGACRVGQKMLLGTGVAFKEGMVKDLPELGIRDAGGALPAVFEKRTVYPDGSLRWVWADFYGPLGTQYTVTIGDRSTALPEPGVQAGRAGEDLTVNNGLLELKWNRQFATPTRVSLISAGKTIVIGQGDGKGVYFVSVSGRRYVLSGKGSELQFTIETCNKLRAVHRLEGWYVAENGERSGRALIRYDIAWKDPCVRMTHQFVVTDDNDKITYKEIGIRFPSATAGKPVVRFGIAGQPPWAAQVASPQNETWLI